MPADEMISLIKTGEKDDATFRRNKKLELSNVLGYVMNEYTDDEQEYIFDRILTEVKDRRKHKYIMRFLENELKSGKRGISLIVLAKMVVLYDSIPAFIYMINSMNEVESYNMYYIETAAIAYNVEAYKPEPGKIKYVMALVDDGMGLEDTYNEWIDDAEDPFEIEDRVKKALRKGMPLKDVLNHVWATIPDDLSEDTLGTFENFASFYKCKHENPDFFDSIKDKMDAALAKYKINKNTKTVWD